MSRFAEKGYRVAYIEPTFPIFRKPDKDRSGYQTNNIFKVSVERKKGNLFIIKPPRGMRFSTNPIVSRINYRYFAYRLGKVLKQLKFEDYILLVYQHLYAPGLDYFKYRKLIYDITDDLPAYKKEDPEKYNHIKKCTEDIIGKSDYVIVTASSLYDKYKDMSLNIKLIPNGYDPNIFLSKDMHVPTDIKEIKGPVIGFIGTLFTFLDFKLIEYVIKQNPDKSFVFIGNCEKYVEAEWKGITNTYKNVYWLGRKNKEDIPSYVHRFDVCINPFKVDDVSRSVSPLKVFEYLAMRKPVVSVKMESLEKEEIAPLIYFASSYQDFNAKLNDALRYKDINSEKSNYPLIANYSWDNLFRKLNEVVEIL
jgi:hypothetical protein